MTPPPSGLVGKITGYFFGGFGSILVVAGILVFVAWKPLGSPPAVANLALACVLIAVWLIQAAFNAWQDWSTSQVMASIGTMLPDQCIGTFGYGLSLVSSNGDLVMRNNSHTSISAVDLVPGDIIVIKHGNKLPADVRFVEVSSDAMFDRSILTGMSSIVEIMMVANISKVNRSPYRQVSTRPKKTTLRQTTLDCKERTAFPVPAWECVLRLAITPSLDALRS